MFKNSSQNKKIYQAEKIFLVPSIRKKVYLNLRNWSQNKNNFLEMFFAQKSFLNIKKISLILSHFLFQVKFCCKKDKKNFFSEFSFLVLRKTF